jgi:DNA-binding Lrp family transcriptional regulator
MLLETAPALRGTEKVKHAVIQWIKTHKPRQSEKFLSQNELAKMLKVDPMTAHKALTELANEGVIYRIRGKGSFIGPDPSVKLGLRLAFVTPGANFDYPEANPEHWHLIQRINTLILHSLRENDSFSSIVVAPGSCSDNNIPRLSKYNAVFFLGFEEYSCLIKKLIKNGTTVVIDGINGKCDLKCVKIFRALDQDTKTAVGYLIERGYKNIAYIGSSTSKLHGKFKFSGYQQALEEYGIELKKELTVTGINHHDEGAKGAAILLNRKVEFDAVFVDTDLKAVKVIEYLNLNGLKVPEDIGAMGFDGVEQCIGPPLYLTSMQMSNSAIAAAIDFIRNNNDKEKEFVIPQGPRKIIENKTTK